MGNLINSYDFNLQDRFCDAPDLKNSYDNVVLPEAFLHFLLIYLNSGKNEFLGIISDKSCHKRERKDKISKMKIVKIQTLFQKMYFFASQRK